MRCKRTTPHDHGKRWSEDTAGEPVALTSKRLRRFAEVFFCGGWVDSRRLSTQPPQKRTHELRSGEPSQKGVRQRYRYW